MTLAFSLLIAFVGLLAVLLSIGFAHQAGDISYHSTHQTVAAQASMVWGVIGSALLYAAGAVI